MKSRLSSSTVSFQIRQHLADPQWTWRSAKTDDRGGEILREQYARAATWLASVQAACNLPTGNGVNGPWHRIPCITPSGSLGVMDIAAGWAIEYDIPVPACVVRFAPAGGGGADSPNQAGGSGSLPSGWKQIVCSPGAKKVEPRHTTPVCVTWGFTTCYSSIGGPLEGDRMERNADLRGVPASRTLERQWGEVAEMGKEMAETLKSAMLRHPGRREHCEIKTTGSCWTGKSRLVAKGTAEDLELFSRWFSTFLPAWQKEMALIAAARMLDECGVKNFAAAATPLRLLPAANEKFAAVGIAI